MVRAGVWRWAAAMCGAVFVLACVGAGAASAEVQVSLDLSNSSHPRLNLAAGNENDHITVTFMEPRYPCDQCNQPNGGYFLLSDPHVPIDPEDNCSADWAGRGVDCPEAGDTGLDVGQQHETVVGVSLGAGNDAFSLHASVLQTLINAGPGNDIVDDFGPTIYYSDNSTGTLIDSYAVGARQIIVNGGPGNDTLQAVNDDDQLAGAGGSDTLIEPPVGFASMEGGPGNDTVSFQHATSGRLIDLRHNTSKLSDLENVDGSNFGDRIYGAPRPGVLDGEGGNDKIYAGKGYHVVGGGDGNDTIYGGGKRGDELSGDAGNDTIYGGPGPDYIHDTFGTNTIYGEGGNDTIISGGKLYGGAGDDKLTCSGPAGCALDGGPGNDVMLGAKRVPDTFVYGPGRDVYDGGGPATGNSQTCSIFGCVANAPDSLSFASSHQPVDVTLDGRANDGTPGQHDNVEEIGQIIGTSGDDKIIAQNSKMPMTLIGGGGDDLLVGGDANDTLNGGGGNDRLYGGPGNDTLDGAAGNDMLQGGPDNDMLEGGSGADDLYGGPGLDTVTYADHVRGVNVSLDGVANDGNSSDYYNGVAAAAASASPPVAKTVGLYDNVHRDVENIIGSPGDDHLIGDDDPNEIAGGNGKDTIEGLGGNDTLIGGQQDGTAPADNSDNASNTLIGGDGNDSLYAGPMGDTLDGGYGDDALYGGDGNDTLDGGYGDDLEDGFAGNDIFLSGKVPDGNDKLDGSAGIDTLDYSDRLSSVTVHLGLGTAGGKGENDTVLNVENVNGGAGDDVLYGSNADNTINGNGGNDTLVGGAGDDVLNGGAANDTIDGGEGNDTLTGGPGTDSFNCGAGTDRVIDRATGETATSDCELFGPAP